MLTNSKDILLAAKKDGYALPAPDYLDIDSARVFVKVAQMLNQPLILSYPQLLDDKVITLEEAALIGKHEAETVEVPVVLHLDHGMDLDFISRAIDLGFTSVMIDASMDSFDENVRKTKEVVAMARPLNITVEAEIGHVGQGENYSDYSNSDSVYTTVEEAVEFVNRTGVDSLAVSIGTAHGVYKGSGKPVLNFERLHELAANVPVPLVLHGGSGSGDDNLHRCATEGISKINIYTDFLMGALNAVKTSNPKDYYELKIAEDKGMAEVLEHYFRLFAK